MINPKQRGRMIDPDQEVEDPEQVEEGDGKTAEVPPEATDDGVYQEEDPTQQTDADGNGVPDSQQEPPNGENPDEQQQQEGASPEDIDRKKLPLRPNKRGRIEEEDDPNMMEKSVSTEDTNKDEVTLINSDIFFEMLSQDILKALEPLQDMVTALEKSVKTNYETVVKAVNDQADMLHEMVEKFEPISKSLETLKGAETIVKAVQDKADESAKTTPATKSDETGNVEIVAKAFTGADEDNSIFVTKSGLQNAGKIIGKAVDYQQKYQKKILTGDDISNVQNWYDPNTTYLRKSRLAEIEAECTKLEK